MPDKKIRVICQSSALQHCCGVVEVGDFNAEEFEKPTPIHSDAAEWVQREHEDELAEFDEVEEGVRVVGGWGAYDPIARSGTGYFISTFIDSEDCKAGYDALVAEGHKIVFQSQPRRNGPGGNEVFIVVFLHKDAK